jgi:hypothetical protein
MFILPTLLTNASWQVGTSVSTEHNVACAKLRLGSGLIAVVYPGRHPDDASGDVLVRVAVGEDESRA